MNRHLRGGIQTEPGIAYFSMEIGMETDVPTYSGGLGVLVEPQAGNDAGRRHGGV